MRDMDELIRWYEQMGETYHLSQRSTTQSMTFDIETDDKMFKVNIQYLDSTRNTIFYCADIDYNNDKFYEFSDISVNDGNKYIEYSDLEVNRSVVKELWVQELDELPEIPVDHFEDI